MIEGTGYMTRGLCELDSGILIDPRCEQLLRLPTSELRRFLFVSLIVQEISLNSVRRIGRLQDKRFV